MLNMLNERGSSNHLFNSFFGTIESAAEGEATLLYRALSVEFTDMIVDVRYLVAILQFWVLRFALYAAGPHFSDFNLDAG